MNHMSIDDAHTRINNVGRNSPVSNDGLALWLELAVPLAMAELAILPDAQRAVRVRVWLADGARAVGAYGDALMFRAKRGTAEVAAAGLAKGIAAEAALNGEATHLGLRFTWPGGRPPAVTPEPAPPRWRPFETVRPAGEFL